MTEIREHEVELKPTVLGYKLNSTQNVYVNYLLSAVVACLIYIVHFSADIVLTYQHFRERNPIWGSLTFSFIYLPVLGCYIITISSWELWPKYEGCGTSNIVWAASKTVQHIFFPIWSIWRFAERIFWSVEAIRTNDDKERNNYVDRVNAPRTIELYHFLQAYLQAIPQILLQLHILLRYKYKWTTMQTVEVQVFSITMSMIKLAMVTTLYQRFKSHKIAGKQYPWLKPYKYKYDQSINVQNADMKDLLFTKSLGPPKPTETEQIDAEQPSGSRLTERRSSSDLYLRASDSPDDIIEVVPEPLNIDSPDFFPKRLIPIKGLPEDDAVGKFISFLWWFCFIIARMLSISTFAYFYSAEIIWILSSHFFLIVALLLYDVHADEVRRAKAIFFIFIGFVYLFCLIEFKIKFKKPKFVYNAFFFLMFSEIFIITLIWYCQIDFEYGLWWYDYIFYLILTTSILSLLSMLFYMCVLKPKKVALYSVVQR